MTATELVARKIASVSTTSKIVVEKSTVPVRTADLLRVVLNNNKLNDRVQFEVISNPEFLAEGQAMQNLEEPSRVLIGGDEATETGQKATQKVADIYRHWIPEQKIITANLFSSELAKLAANTFLAQRISSVNLSEIMKRYRLNNRSHISY